MVPKNIMKISRGIVLSVLLFLLLQRAAYADSAFLGCALLGYYGIIGLFLVVIVEGLVLSIMTAAGWGRGLYASLWINLGSMLAGIIFYAIADLSAQGIMKISPTAIVILIAIVTTVLGFIYARHNRYFLTGIFLADISLLIFLALSKKEHLYLFELLVLAMSRLGPVLLSTIFNFGVSLAIESIYVHRFIKHPRVGLAVLAGNVISYTGIALVLLSRRI